MNIKYNYNCIKTLFFFYEMSGSPDLNNEPELIGIKTRDDEIKNLKYQTERHDNENILKSLKADNEKYKKNINH